jgi:hypothetical protein
MEVLLVEILLLIGILYPIFIFLYPGMAISLMVQFHTVQYRAFGYEIELKPTEKTVKIYRIFSIVTMAIIVLLMIIFPFIM